MKSYEPVGKEAAALVATTLKKFFPELAKAGVTLDLLDVSTDGHGHPLSCHGYPAQAVVSIIGLKARAAGRADAEIVFDRVNYAALTDRQRQALIHHELTHLEVKFEKKSKIIKRDDLGRPCLKMRKHDWEFGWFDASAKIFGDDSAEVRQARLLMTQSGQLYFEFTKTAA